MGARILTPARRTGEGPTARELAEKALADNAVLRSVVEKLIKRLDALECVQVGEDGAAPKPLGPNWLPIKKAAAVAGYASESGLRAAIARAKRAGERPWWDLRGTRIYVDIDHCPHCAG